MSGASGAQEAGRAGRWVGARPPGRGFGSSRPPLWRLAPWTRAPLLGLRQPAAVVAVLVTSAILACAAASGPLFLSSARSAALQQQLAQGCAEVGWGQTGIQVTRLYDRQDTDARLTRSATDALAYGWEQVGRRPETVLATAAIGGRDSGALSGVVTGPDGVPLSIPASVFHRPGALSDVQVVQGSDAEGIWLPVGYTEGGGLAVGDQLTVAGVPVTLAGTYRDLFTVDAGPAWCDYRVLYANDTSANSPPPALGIATDPDTFFRVAAGYPAATALEQVPVDRDTLTVSGARSLLAEQDRAQRAALTRLPPELARGLGVYAGPVPNDRLPDAVRRAELVQDGLRGPVVPVAAAGGLLALVLVAAAGSFWADRRATEVRLLAARGVGPVPLAGKAALELAMPALAGAALGWAASRLLIGALGPADDLDPSATRAAVWAGVAAFVVGLGCAATVAGLRARGTAERPLGAAARWPSRVPWELALLMAAGWCWALLETRPAVVDVAGVAQVNGLLVAFPLLAVAGTAVLLARLLTAGLPRLRRWVAGRSPAVFLAVNRLAAARLATATLLVAVTLPVAVLGYTATLTASSQTTLDAKVGVQIGATRAVTSVSRFPATPAIDALGSLVVRYGEADVTTPDGERTDVQVLAVDPATFGRTAFWDDSFADVSLPELMAALDGPDVAGRLPVVATGLPRGEVDLRLGTQEVPAELAATARVLPGRRSAEPVVLVAADRLPEISRNAGADRTAEVWTSGPAAPAVAAVAEAGGVPGRVVDQAQVLNTADFLGITWTFGYLSALATFVGVIAIGGLLLYLEARSRTRVSGYVMARRLGLSRAGHLRSLLVELAGIAVGGLVLGAVLAAGAVALVYRRLDVDLLRPPTPLLAVPWTSLAVTAAVTLTVTALAALYAQRAADRADPASVLREDA